VDVGKGVIADDAGVELQLEVDPAVRPRAAGDVQESEELQESLWWLHSAEDQVRPAAAARLKWCC